VYSAYARRDDPPPQHVAVTATEDDLIDQAVAARDEHAIKFTEACLREHHMTGDAVFLEAAADVVTRLRAS
jgi:hypothetical protein